MGPGGGPPPDPLLGCLCCPCFCLSSLVGGLLSCLCLPFAPFFRGPGGFGGPGGGPGGFGGGPGGFRGGGPGGR